MLQGVITAAVCFIAQSLLIYFDNYNVVSFVAGILSLGLGTVIGLLMSMD